MQDQLPPTLLAEAIMLKIEEVDMEWGWCIRRRGRGRGGSHYGGDLDSHLPGNTRWEIAVREAMEHNPRKKEEKKDDGNNEENKEEITKKIQIKIKIKMERRNVEREHQKKIDN